MFLLEYTRKFVLAHELGFSSPIFGDMFLLNMKVRVISDMPVVFVSYIRRYILTNAFLDNENDFFAFSSPIFGDIFLLLVN